MAYSGSRQAARVRWQIGQPLLPEHFHAQEESLRLEAALRAHALGIPAWGFQQLDWDGAQLERGIIQLRKLTVFFDSGEVIVSDANADLPPPLDIGATGLASVQVFLHLDSASRFVANEPGDPHEEGVERIIRQLRLDTDPSHEEGFAMIELGTFEQHGATPIWRLKPDSLPALVSVQNDAFRAHAFAAIEDTVNNLHDIVARHKQQSIASAVTNAATVLVQRGMHELEALWQHMRDGHLNPHPYEVFQTLRGMYFDLCVLHKHTPPTIFYMPNQLGSTFAMLFKELRAVTALDRQSLPHLPFAKEQGFQVCHLRKGMKKGTRAFWLIKKKHVAQTLNMRGVKLAARGRIVEVENRALRGIPYERVHNPPFSQEFSSNIEFYALNGGAEWDKAVAEGKIAFYDVGELSELESYLYYVDS